MMCKYGEKSTGIFYDHTTVGCPVCKSVLVCVSYGSYGYL